MRSEQLSEIEEKNFEGVVFLKASGQSTSGGKKGVSVANATDGSIVLRDVKFPSDCSKSFRKHGEGKSYTYKNDDAQYPAEIFT